MNIAEILKDKSKGTKLYSPLCGKCYLERVRNNEDIEVVISLSKDTSLSLIFDKEGRKYLDKTSYISPYGKCLLFPSNRIRDWSKFAWKKGDVLVNLSGNTECIFKEYIDDTYKTFTGVHCFNSDPDDNEYIPETMFSTNAFKLQDPKLIPCYINTIEERFNGKLNKETLLIEPNELTKPKYSFKPFDKVLVRDSDDEKWSGDFFSYMEDDEAICTGTYWLQCLPYNEETAKLIGTTKSLEDIR